jgi:hypothetical protein
LYSANIGSTIRRISELEPFLRKVFSTQSKKELELRMKQIAENDDGLQQTSEVYFSTANLVLGVRHLTEWEEEVSELVRNGQTSEPCLKQILQLCQNKSFFSHIGYGPLIQNIEFLYKLLNDLKMSGSVLRYMKKLNKMISKIDEIEAKLQSQMTEKERLELLRRKYYNQTPLLQEVMFLSSFSKTVHSKLQTAIMDVHIRFQESKSTDLNELDNTFLYALLELDETEAFTDEVKRNKLNEEFFRNLVYPPLPPKKIDLNCLFASHLSFN